MMFIFKSEVLNSLLGVPVHKFEKGPWATSHIFQGSLSVCAFSSFFHRHASFPGVESSFFSAGNKPDCVLRALQSEETGVFHCSLSRISFKFWFQYEASSQPTALPDIPRAALLFRVKTFSFCLIEREVFTKLCWGLGGGGGGLGF